MFFIIFLLIIISDQIIKFFVQNELIGQSIVIIPELLEFTYIKNNGIAFGMFQNNNIIFLIVIPILLILFIYFILKFKLYFSKIVMLSTVFLISGGISNYIDRVRFGYIIDYIYVKNFSIFNIADIFVVIGTFLLGYYFIKVDKRSSIDGAKARDNSKL